MKSARFHWKLSKTPAPLFCDYRHAESWREREREKNSEQERGRKKERKTNYFYIAIHTRYCDNSCNSRTWINAGNCFWQSSYFQRTSRARKKHGVERISVILTLASISLTVFLSWDFARVSNIRTHTFTHAHTYIQGDREKDKKGTKETLYNAYEDSRILV